MAILNTKTLGPNSYAIDMPKAWNYTNIHESLEVILTSHGWNLSTSSSTQRFYHKLHKGDTNVNYYKRLVINVVTSNKKIYLQTGEKATIDSTTSSNITSSGHITGNSDGGRLYVFVGDAHVILALDNFNGDDGGFVGVTEYTNVRGDSFGPGATESSGRIMRFDGSTFMGQSLVQVDIASYISTDGTKQTVSTYNTLTSEIGAWGHTGGGGTSQVLSASAHGLLDQADGPLNTSFAADINIVTTNSTSSSRTYIGKIDGIKVLNTHAGLMMDVISINVDADGFCDKNGTPTDHFIITGKAYSTYEEVCFAVAR